MISVRVEDPNIVNKPHLGWIGKTSTQVDEVLENSIDDPSSIEERVVGNSNLIYFAKFLTFSTKATVTDSKKRSISASCFLFRSESTKEN